jgi:hypothetical protein
MKEFKHISFVENKINVSDSLTRFLCLIFYRSNRGLNRCDLLTIENNAVGSILDDGRLFLYR